MAILQTLLVNAHFIACIFWNFIKKIQALNILKGAQAQVLELCRIKI